MIVFISISLFVQIEFSVWPRGRGGGSSGRTSRGIKMAGAVARTATGSISDFTGMAIAVGERTQQVTQADSGIPPPLSGQHAASVAQAIVLCIGMSRAIAALPKASEASAISMRTRAIMTRNTGLSGREVKRTSILAIRLDGPDGYPLESSDGLCRRIVVA